MKKPLQAITAWRGSFLQFQPTGVRSPLQLNGLGAESLILSFASVAFVLADRIASRISAIG